MTSVTLNDLVEIVKKNPDAWQASRKMQSLTNGEPEGTLGRLLWQGLQEDRLDPAVQRDCWDAMARAVDAYDGALFLKFLSKLAVLDAGQSYPSWSESDLPGWSNRLDAFLKAKTQARAAKPDPRPSAAPVKRGYFFKHLALKWTDLPTPQREALGAKLVGLGHLDIGVLPVGLLDEYAARFVETERPYWGVGVPAWTVDVWEAALMHAALSDGVASIADEKLFARLVERATPAEVVTLAAKMKGTFGQSLVAVDAIGARGAEVIPALEKAIAGLHHFAEQDKRQPAFYFVLGYCRACQVAGRPVSESLDKAISRFVDGHRPGWSGGYFNEHQTKICEILAVIPQARLSAILLDTKNVPWLLVGAAPTEAVCQRVASTLAAMTSGGPYGWDTHRDLALNLLGAAAVPALCEVLMGDVGTQREVMVRALGTAGDDRAVPALVTQLGEKTKGPREAAKTALLGLTPQVVVEHLSDALGSRRKDARLAGAEVLRALPPTREGFELAQSYLETEKVADIKTILEGVQRPAEEEAAASGIDPARFANIVAALKKENGTNWRKFAEVGDVLVEMFFAYLAEDNQGRHVGYSNRTEASLVELLAHFADSASARRALTDAIGAFSNRAPKLLNMLVKHIPDLPTELADAFIEGRIQRSASFGPGPRWGNDFDDEAALEWICGDHPTQAWNAVVAGLQNGKKAIRDKCVAFMLSSPEKIAVDAHVLPLLESRTKDLRQTGVELLASFATPEHLPLLEATLKKEKVRGVRASIEETIVRVHARGLDVAAFEDDAAGNVDLDARLADLVPSALPAKVESALPDLKAMHWKTGAPLSEGARRWFIGEALAESADHIGQKVRQVRARLNDEDCHALCDYLIQLAGHDDKGWPLYMQAILADAAQIESLGRRLETFASSQSYGWSDYAIDVLVRTGSDQAARIMDDWFHRTRKNALRHRARSGVRQIAAQRGVTVEELLESAMGTFGFDASGVRTFDYGGRNIIVRLGADSELTYEDEDGKRLKSMPAARKDDDAALVKAAKAQVKQLKVDFKRIRRTQVRRLEDSMVTARRWAPSVWHERFAQPPLLRTLAMGLVWGVYDKSDKLQRTFQLDDAAEAFDLDLEPVVFGDDDHIGIAHPLELGDERTKWLELLADAEQTQPFQQLERPVFEPGHFESLDAYLVKLAQVEPKTFLGRLNKLGYELGHREDAGMINASTRQVGEWVITLGHTGFAPEAMDWLDGVEVSGVGLQRGNTSVTLDKLPTLIYSEVLHDIHALMQTA